MPSEPSGLHEERPRIVLPLAEVGVDPVTEREAIDTILLALEQGEGGLVVTPNVDHLHHLAAGGPLNEVYAQADLVLADGMPLVWASRLLRRPLPERVAGSQLLPALSAAAAAAGRSIFLLGGTPGAAEQVVETYTSSWPGLKVAGVHCPPFGFEHDSAATAAVHQAIVDAAPDIVFTALGAPKQELLNLELHRSHPSAWYLGVGGAVDMAAGNVRRAPEWAQRLGAEWVFRLLQEPGRMARRYLVDDLPFAGRLLVASARRGRHGQGGA